MKKYRDRLAAFFAGALLTFGGAVWAGLESGTYISDLVATNPLGSDLASTLDDHLRLIKGTIKNTFPNINNAVSATDEELSLLAGKTGTVWTSANDGAASGLDADLLDGNSSAAFVLTSAYTASDVLSKLLTVDGTGSLLDADLLDGISIAGVCQTSGSGCPGGVTGAANPTASVGLSAVNGSATTFMRSDGAPALSQSITPTWSGAHVFTALGSAVIAPSILVQNNRPGITLDEQDGAANNQLWGIEAQAEQLSFFAATDAGSDSQWMLINRTSNTVDSIALAATAFTVNAVAMTPVSSTFTITGTGFTANPTGTARYEKIGNIVVLYLPELSATSNATTFGLTGIPAAIRPTRAQRIPVPVTRDNGSDQNTSFVQVNTDGTGDVAISGGIASVVNWTSSGTKALGLCTITYNIT